MLFMGSPNYELRNRPVDFEETILTPDFPHQPNPIHCRQLYLLQLLNTDAHLLSTSAHSYRFKKSCVYLILIYGKP